MKIGKPNGWISRFEVNGRRIVMSRNGINGAARPIKNCRRQDVYEAMADLYDEFYFKEIDTDKMIPIEWIEQHIKELDTELQSLYSRFYSQRDSKEKDDALLKCVGFRTTLRAYETVLSDWEKENGLLHD